MSTTFKELTESIPLPSKGWFYSNENPLATGEVELRYPTARHEDILTSRNLIVKGTAIDKFIEDLIVDPNIKYGDLLIGDKNALFLASRIMAYGKTYECKVTCPKCQNSEDYDVNLEEIEEKDYDFSGKTKGLNEFSFKLPHVGSTITFKILSQSDELMLERELEQMRKIKNKSGIDNEVTTRMRYSVISVDGETDRTAVTNAVENMPSMDAKAFREFAREQMPDIDLSFSFTCNNCGYIDRVEVPITREFFWPTS
jgi:hypothetical protein